MGRDPHRAPGRLAPQRLDYERGAPTKPPPDRQPASPLPRQDRSVPDLTPSERGDSPEESFDFETPPMIQERSRRDDSLPPERSEEDDPSWAMDDTQPKPRAPAAPKPEVFSDPERLSIQERHQLLIHTIRLHERKWRLAGIRANPKTDRLQAFLIPANRKLDLKEAISRNQAMIITIDAYGNTEVRKPKKAGPLRRVINWLVGE
jgi:hypothetical protein